MKTRLIKIIMLGMLAALPALAGAQTRLTGTVTDFSGEPIAGATVLVKGTTSGAQTDLDGKWSLEVPDPQGVVLQFSCLGYRLAEEKVGSRAVFDVVLEETSELLDDVVVVGYGTQKKVNLTGSVATVSAEELGDNRTILNTAAALAGLVPGMTVMQTTGKPGAEKTSMNIRGIGSFTSGASSPYVLIDGVAGSLDNINPSDIETISVLKDAASTAIYGTRAANGVILVTTKKGSESKPMVSYSFKGVFEVPNNNLDYVGDYVSYMQYINEYCDVRNAAHQFSDTSIELWTYAKEHPNELNEYGVPLYMAYPSTDWQEEMYQNSFSQEHQISISGGSKTVRYMMSGRYLDNTGVMHHDGIKSASQKGDITASIEADVTKWFTIGNKLYAQILRSPTQNIEIFWLILSGVTPGMYIGEPGKWGKVANPEDAQECKNHFGECSYYDGTNTAYNVSDVIYATIRPFKGFSIEGKFNYATHSQRILQYTTNWVEWDYQTNTMYSEKKLEDATIRDYNEKDWHTTTEVLARYETLIKNDHALSAILGYSTFVSSDWSTEYNKRGATDWSLHDLSTYSELTSSSSTSPNKNAIRSYFARVNYGFKDRYLFEANVRIDGSSKFGPDSRYGVFPSFSAGWKINEEPWMRGAAAWLSQLKVRASWGQTGNDTGIGYYDWQSSYSVGNLMINGDYTQGLYVGSASNTKLKWETTSSTDVGIDAGFFNQRLTAELDYYYKGTRDILYRPSTYLTMGNLSAVPENLGRMWNQGVEIALNWRDQVGNFFYYAGVNFSYNKNLVTGFKGKLVEGWADGEYYTNFGEVNEEFNGGYIVEGHAIGEHYLYQRYRGTGKGYSGSGEVDINAGPKDGMIRTETDMNWVRAMLDAGYTFFGSGGSATVDKNLLWYGDFIYADLNGDGDYGNSYDRAFTGHSATPSYNLGITFGFSWKGLDFSMIWSGAFDYYLLYNLRGYNTAECVPGNYLSQSIMDDHYFYDPDNPSDSRTNINATYPRLGVPGDDLDFYYCKSDYLKLKNVTVGYTLPEKITRKFYVKQLKFYVSAENVLTLTKFPGEDPELGANYTYPLMRQYTIGAQITF